MISNRVHVANNGLGRDTALKEVDKYAEYLKLSKKNKMHLLLLVEETLGMVGEIVGDFNADLWFEGTTTECSICMEANVEMSDQKREELLKTSSSGKNSSANGMMGMIKNIVELFWMGYKEGVGYTTEINYFDYAMGTINSMSNPRMTTNWKLSEYKNDVEKQKDSTRIEEWDKLEKSIVANVADDISVSIEGDKIKYIITKSFS